MSGDKIFNWSKDIKYLCSFCSNWNCSFNLKSPSPHSVTRRLFLSIWALSEGILPALASSYRKQSSYRNKTNVMWTWISAVSFQSTFHTVKVENCSALMSNEAVECMLFEGYINDTFHTVRLILQNVISTHYDISRDLSMLVYVDVVRPFPLS